MRQDTEPHRDQQLARANAELTTTNRALRQSNFDLEQFAFAASHDLSEPLRMVTSYLDLLSSRYGDSLDERGGQYLAFAMDGADRMRALIEDLLDLARISTADRLATEVPLGPLVQQVVLHVTGPDPEAVTTTVDPLPNVVGDAPQLRRLFTNLIGNAVKFSDARPAQVAITAAKASEHLVRIEVVDRGIGIPAEHRDDVFKMFRRLHPRSAYPGTGMGLAMCKNIVERHGGEIGIEPGVPTGTRVWFTLPPVRVAAA
jgi:signal transduction histidine kinase